MMAFAQPITDTADNDQNSAAAASGTASSFPLARVKKIMKADKDVNLVSAEAVHLTSIASELFLELLVKKAADVSQNEKRRTILYKDFATAVKGDPRLAFLSELIPEPVSVQAALEAQRAHGLFHSAVQSVPHSPQLSEMPASAEDLPSVVADDSEGASKGRSNSSSIADFFAKRAPTLAAATEVEIEDQ